MQKLFVWDDDKVAAYSKNPIDISVFKNNWITKNIIQIDYDLVDVFSFIDLQADANKVVMFKQGDSHFYAAKDDFLAVHIDALLNNDRYIIHSVLRKIDQQIFKIGLITEYGKIKGFGLRGGNSASSCGLCMIDKNEYKCFITDIKQIALPTTEL